MTGDKSIETLRIQDDATLSMSGNRLKIEGGMSFRGSLDGSGNVYFAGSSEQVLKGTGGTFYDITVKNPNGVAATSGNYQVAHELDIEDGTLDVSGADEWTMRSDSSTIASRIDSLSSDDSLIGTIRVERWINSGNAGWIDLASPLMSSGGQPNVADWDDDLYISGKTTGGFDDGCAWSSGCFWSVKGYDPALGDYVDVTDTGEVLTQGKAFELFIGDQGGTSNMLYDTTVTVDGYVRGGSKSVSVSTANGAFNLIGNPFASQIDFDRLYKNNNIGDTYYVAAATGNFETYQVGVGSSDPSVPNNGAIASSQGFWVTSNDGSDVTFTQSMKTDAPVSFSKKSSHSQEHFNLKLESNMNRFSCRSFIRAEVGTDKGYDRADVPHRPSPIKGAPALVFGTPSGEPLRWNAIPPSKDSVSIPVIVNVDTPGTYSIEANGDPAPYRCAYLEDKAEDAVYYPRARKLSFEFEEGTDRRFTLHLKKQRCRTSAMKEQEPGRDGGFTINPNPSSKGKELHLRLKGMKGQQPRIKVLGIKGKLYYSKRIMVRQNARKANLGEVQKELAPGSYIVSVVTQEIVYNRKLVVQ